MATRLLIAATVLLGAPASHAQLPFWADSALRAAGLDQRFTLSSHLNPVYAFGDFDRDGLLDVAVEILDAGGLRCGLAIVHRIDRSVHIVGAGQPIGNGEDHLARWGGWGVASPRHQGRHEGFGSDLVFVTDPTAPSGWVVWDGRSYVWVAGVDGA
jgi:hypothetical protein